MYYILLGGPTVIYEGSWEECEDTLENLCLNKITWYWDKEDITEFLIKEIDDLWIVSQEEFDNL